MLIDLYEEHGLEEVEDAIQKGGLPKDEIKDTAEHAVSLGYIELFEYLRPKFNVGRHELSSWVNDALTKDEHTMAQHLVSCYTPHYSLSPFIIRNCLNREDYAAFYEFLPHTEILKGKSKGVFHDIDFLQEVFYSVLKETPENEQKDLLDALYDHFDIKKLIPIFTKYDSSSVVIRALEEHVADKTFKALQQSTPQVSRQKRSHRL